MIHSLIVTLLMQENPSSIFEIVKLIITGVSGIGISALVTAFLMRRKVYAESNKLDVDAIQVLSNTSVALLDPMKKQIEYLNSQLESANTKIEEMKKTITNLENKLHYYQMILKADIVEYQESDFQTPQ